MNAAKSKIFGGRAIAQPLSAANCPGAAAIFPFRRPVRCVYCAAP